MGKMKLAYGGGAAGDDAPDEKSSGTSVSAPKAKNSAKRPTASTPDISDFFTKSKKTK